MSKVTKTLLVLLILAILYLAYVSKPLLAQHNTWFYVDPETGINYIVVEGDAITPRMKQNGEYYISR